ncbi:hypothetical protein BZG36_02299 [Bifiguratus adelaidae]|uniref:ZPR1 jelly-roll domain-containing protein n=1 Tax=Bifiguratus adelaidae TaxID=1938954 RepID=A0A261Y3P8_9FUNG|nr:hypothetical protein BZG36_02299 [Bifiguratus adelaidae]
MGRELPETNATYHLNLGHQEVDRTIEELEAICKETPAEWIAVEPIAELLTRELGYEDRGEFEDALGGTFQQFLEALPMFTVKTDEKDRLVLHYIPEPEESAWKARTLKLHVTSSAQLWKVLLKSAHADLDIPHMGFGKYADGKRIINTLYNIISESAFNLDSYAKADTSMSEEHKDKILDCAKQLNALLDVNEPFDIVVTDPSGQSEYSDMTGVETEA